MQQLVQGQRRLIRTYEHTWIKQAPEVQAFLRNIRLSLNEYDERRLSR